MSTAHTAGPWIVGTDTARGARPGRVHILAKITGILNRVAIAEYDFDAPLIAAAPELLAALEQIAALPAVTAKNADAMRNIALAAIAKAVQSS